MFENIKKHIEVHISYSNFHEEIEEISGIVIEVNRKRNILTIKDDEGKKHFFYDWEIEKIEERERVTI